MPLDSQRLEDLRLTDRVHRYTRHDTRLYALSIGFGADPLDRDELRFVTPGAELLAVPSMASIFGGVIAELTAACELQRPELALHASQRLEVLSPLPPEGELSITGSISGLYDRGAERGAEIHMQAEARLRDSDLPLYRATYVTVARGDGGFGGSPPQRSRAASSPADKDPDQIHRFPTRRGQALLYALNGDDNPIHIDPAIASKAGFDVPILHGLCTYGIACRAVLAEICDYRPERIRTFDARFSAPVLPGDTLAVDLWSSRDHVDFQVRAEERGITVLKRGHCRLSE